MAEFQEGDRQVHCLPGSDWFQAGPPGAYSTDHMGSSVVLYLDISTYIYIYMYVLYIVMERDMCCVCMCTYIYVYTHVLMSLYLSICICVYIYICIRVCSHLCIFAHVTYLD